MKMRYGYDRKSFSENLAPLYGAVRKSVGRPWNKFYSELCENFDKRSIINQHILDHLFQYVEIKNIYVGNDGKLYVRNAYQPVRELKDSSTEFYVDPRDGILKYNNQYKTWNAKAREREIERAKAREAVFRQIDKYHVLHLIDGVWFEFELREIPEGKIVYDKPPGKDVFKPNFFSKEKQWFQLAEYEKQRLGVERRVGGHAFDVFTGDTVHRDKGVVYRSSSLYPGNSSYVYRNNLYHATKKTASRKTLKKAGVV